jgi:hypothetical protein
MVLPGRCGEVAACDVGKVGHAEVDGGAPGGLLVDLGEFLAGCGEADFQSFDLAEPALALGFGDARVQVVVDLDESGALGRIGPQ